VIEAAKNDTVPAGGNAPGNAQSFGSIVNKVISAAYGPFRDGLAAALLTSAALILLAAALAAVAARRTPTGPSNDPQTLDISGWVPVGRSK
jgi:hypothetical protein